MILFLLLSDSDSVQPPKKHKRQISSLMIADYGTLCWPKHSTRLDSLMFDHQIIVHIGSDLSVDKTKSLNINFTGRFWSIDFCGLVLMLDRSRDGCCGERVERIWIFICLFTLTLCRGDDSNLMNWTTRASQTISRNIFFFSSEEVNFCSFRNANEHWTNRGRWWWRLNEEENEQNWCSENECEPMKGQNQNHEFKTFFFLLFRLVCCWVKLCGIYCVRRGFIHSSKKISSIIYQSGRIE